MWLAALPPPRNGPTTALGGMRGPVPMGQLGPQTPPPPRSPSFLQKVTGAVQWGGAAPYK